MPNASTAAAQAAATPQGGDQNPSAEGSGKTFTQEEVNAMLAREKREQQAKYRDYDKYKAAYDEAQKRADAEKSELQQATERAEKAEAEAAALKAKQERAGWVAAVSKETGVPEAALHGETEDEVRACADALKGYFDKPSAPVVQTGEPSADEDGTTGDPLRDLIINKI